MFCNNCGKQLPDGTRFCSGCGAKLGDAGASNAVARPAGPADEVSYKIYGDDIQMVEIELEQGRGVIAEAGAMTYMESAIKMETIFGDGSAADANQTLTGKLLGAGKRALSGESLFITVFQNTAASPAHVAFAAPYPGKITPVELTEFGGTLICQKSAFLCAARGISLDIHLQKKLGAGLFGGEGFIMQKLTGDGLVFIHAGGTIIKKELAEGEVLRIDTGCLVAISSTVDYDVRIMSDIKSGLFGGEGVFIATLTGPGHVWLQSLPISRMINSMLDAGRSGRGENRGINNPIGEVTGGLGGALGGLFKS